MPMQNPLRSDRKKKFTGSPLKLPQLNTSGPMAVDIVNEQNAYSPGWLRRVCFEGPLTPLSSEGDYDVGFDTSTVTVTDTEVDQSAYSPRSRLQRICFEDPLTPLSSEGDSFDSLFESGNSTDQTPIQPPLTRTLAMSSLDNINLPPPALTREGTHETFDGPLTPLGFGTEMAGEFTFVASASRAVPTSKETSDTYVKPQASLFDAAHACGWFPDPPPVPEGEVVVSDFSEIGKIVQFPPSAWRLGPVGRLVRNHDVKFGPSTPIFGPLPVSGVVEREMQALMRRKEEVMKVLEEEGDMGMRGIDSDVLLGEDQGKADAENSDEAMEDLKKPNLVGPEGTEIYDGLSDYPEEWASHRSSGLCYHPTQKILE